MRAEDADILIIPGLGGSSPEHWQSRWEKGLKTARRVEQDDWDRPDRGAWRTRIKGAIEAAERPVILVAHSLGVLSALEAGSESRVGVAGAFLVAPPDAEDESRRPPGVSAFAPLPSAPLGYPAFLIASRNDPFMAFGRAEALAEIWKSKLIDAGPSGHLNVASGHGPWPEGLLLFSRLLKLVDLSPEKV
jgi:uncharacterized protein